MQDAADGAGEDMAGMSSELLLKPFKLAIATDSVRMQEMSLGCLHKLLAYGILPEEGGIEVRH